MREYDIYPGLLGMSQSIPQDRDVPHISQFALASVLFRAFARLRARRALSFFHLRVVSILVW